MNSKLITLINEDFYEILELKDISDIDKYMKRFNTPLKYSVKLKKLLYEETDYCLVIFNNNVKNIITDYVNHKINYEELEAFLLLKFDCKNTTKKEKFNVIFPEFIQLIIDNIDILNKERDEIIVVKPKPKNKYLPDSDLEEDLEDEYIESDNDEIEIEENETNELELIDYDTKREPFDLRDNQKDAINNTIAQDFKSGIHCQIMGAGKTFIMLNIIYQHWLKYQRNLVYIISTDKIEILKSWFMIDILDKFKADYVKSKNISKIDNGTFKTEEYLGYEARKLKNTKYYKVKDGDTTYTFNYDRFTKWTEDEIIDINDFDISENIINKKISYFDEPLDRPVIYIVNNAFLKAGNKYKKINYDNIGLVLVDECHSVSGKQNYEMLEYIRRKGTNIQGFSATPLRPVKNASDQLLKVYGENPYDEERNELNIISNYDMIKALKDGIILPFVHTIISPITDEKSLKIKSNNKPELTLQKIIEDYFICNPDLPYKKGVAWVNSISKIAKDEGVYYKEIKAICGNKIKLFVSYSGNKVYPEVNELSEFEKCTTNALLLCVNRVKEGSDIKNLDCGLFLDAVKNRSIVSSLQSIGRIMRPDDKKKKKFAHIIESIKLDEQKTVESITVSKVLNYYKKILNIASLSQQSVAYIDEILRLFDETEIINDDEQKAINIVIDRQKDIKCRINLNIKQIDWRIFQDALREKLSDRLKIDEDEILNREFVKLKYSVKKLKLDSKDKYKKYAKDNKLEESPEIKYEKWWKGWYEFLDIDVNKYPKNKEQLIKICKDNGIKDLKGYYQFAEELNLPSMPEELYINFGILENELNNDFNRRRK